METLKKLEISAKVIIRLGHVTHAEPIQLEEIQKLGLIVEANLTSNLVTGSITEVLCVLWLLMQKTSVFQMILITCYLIC
ncbi:hypothetical protein [Dulcicalothrix desertica]|uniref:hypothetical protein n=1 Tax=Dulcicalothrix desertica TaxID=32056 RepID=UPI001F20A6F3|nr:hypothetical protein [Dulcicalothrix desertica]